MSQAEILREKRRQKILINAQERMKILSGEIQIKNISKNEKYFEKNENDSHLNNILIKEDNEKFFAEESSSKYSDIENEIDSKNLRRRPLKCNNTEVSENFKNDSIKYNNENSLLTNSEIISKNNITSINTSKKNSQNYLDYQITTKSDIDHLDLDLNKTKNVIENSSIEKDIETEKVMKLLYIKSFIKFRFFSMIFAAIFHRFLIEKSFRNLYFQNIFCIFLILQIGFFTYQFFYIIDLTFKCPGKWILELLMFTRIPKRAIKIYKILMSFLICLIEDIALYFVVFIFTHCFILVFLQGEILLGENGKN